MGEAGGNITGRICCALGARISSKKKQRQVAGLRASSGLPVVAFPAGCRGTLPRPDTTAARPVLMGAPGDTGGWGGGRGDGWVGGWVGGGCEEWGATQSRGRNKGTAARHHRRRLSGSTTPCSPYTHTQARTLSVHGHADAPTALAGQGGPTQVGALGASDAVGQGQLAVGGNGRQDDPTRGNGHLRRGHTRGA